MSQFASVLELASLDGENGFRLYGSTNHETAGWRVSAAGDINHDGFGDLLIGTRDGGDAFAVFGGPASLAALDAADGVSDGAITLNQVDGNDGFKIHAPRETEFGFDVSGVGDVNGDGIDDFAIGTPYGATAVLFGASSGFAAHYNFRDVFSVNGSDGYVITGNGPYGFGGSIARAGDIDGDGVGDMVFGALDEAGRHGALNAGGAYVVFGSTAKLTALDAADGSQDGHIAVTELDGTTGFHVTGFSADEYAGISVAGADISGDGIGDIMIGAPGLYGSSAGNAYLIFGRITGFGPTLNVNHLHGHNGYVIAAPDAPSNTGVSVASAGDVNGDGIADMIIGALVDGPNSAGTAYVVFGGRTNLAHLDAADGDKDGHIALNNIDGVHAFAIIGADANSLAGYSVSSAGDVNGDGFDDILIGAPADGHAGKAYVLFGAAGGFAPVVGLAALDGNNGFVIDAEHSGFYTGISVSAAGDLNGDGFADLLVGASDSRARDHDSGAAYIVFGHKPGEAVTIHGTPIDNTIHGSDFNDVLIGRDGDDTLTGYDGKDLLDGGNGSNSIDGGGGADTISVRGFGNNTFTYQAASDSTGHAYDIISGFDGDLDSFIVPVAVSAIDAPVSADTFGHIGEALQNLDANAAELVTVGSNGHLFLAIDQNGVVGYQAGDDLLIQLKDSAHTGDIGVASFST